MSPLRKAASKKAAARSKPHSEPAKSKTLTVSGMGDMSRDRAMAVLATSASVTAASVSVEYSRATFGDVSLTESMSTLAEAVAEVREGNLAKVDSLLIAQAVALNSVFTDLSLRAARSEYLDTMERYLRLALKAQGQCRATLETLATIKNPPFVITRQANIAHGPQQVNNSAAPAATVSANARGENSEAVRNELMEVRDGEWVDRRAAREATAGDTAMASLGTIDWPTNC